MRVGDECGEVGNPTTQQRREVAKQGARHGGSQKGCDGRSVRPPRLRFKGVAVDDHFGFSEEQAHLGRTPVAPNDVRPLCQSRLLDAASRSRETPELGIEAVSRVQVFPMLAFSKTCFFNAGQRPILRLSSTDGDA